MDKAKCLEIAVVYPPIRRATKNATAAAMLPIRQVWIALLMGLVPVKRSQRQRARR